MLTTVLTCRCGHSDWRHYLGHGWCIGMRDETPKCDCTSFTEKPDYCIRCGAPHRAGECGRDKT